MASIDWRRCPCCGTPEFEVVAEERLAGRNRPRLTLAPDGRALRADWGLTEPDWTSRETVRYVCGCCEQELPEAHQAELDRRLDIVRSESAD